MQYYNVDDVACLEKIADFVSHHGLVGAVVTVQQPNGTIDSAVLRGVMLDEYGAVCAVLAITASTPFCYMLHCSRVQDLSPVWNVPSGQTNRK